MHQLAHWEIPSTDLAKSMEFYASLFKWKSEKIDDSYAMFSVEGGLGGGFSMVDHVRPPCIEVYIEVADILQTLQGVELLGGKGVHEKTEIGNNMGFWAAFEDPCGVRIGIWSKT